MSAAANLRQLLKRVRLMVQRDRLARQLDEELEFHAEMLARDAQLRGLSVSDANVAARRRLGNRTRIREESRDAWTVGEVDRSLQDIRYALRSVQSRPGFAATIVLTLALGIGANTAVFSLVNCLLLQPVPGVTNARRLVMVRFGAADHGWFPASYPYLEDVRRESRTLADVAGYERTDVHVTAGTADGAWRAGAEIVSPNYFTVLGVRQQLGRVFSPDDAVAPGSHDEVVISDRAWRGAFAADPGIVGRRILINARPAIIIGVAPKGFLGPQLPGATDYWVPVSMHPRILPDFLPRTLLQERSRGTFLFQFVGRMRDEATVASVQAELTALQARLTPRARATASDDGPMPVVSAGLGLGEFEHARVKGIVAVLGAVVALVLLTACANTANLLVARGVTRRHEMAIRRAIGADRGRLVRQHVTESLVFASLGGVLAVALAWTLMRLIGTVRLVPSMPPLGDVPIDWRVLAFTVVATVVTAILVGAAPAMLSTRVDPQTALRAGTLRTYSGMRLRGALMAAQIALSLILLVGAGLFTRTLANLRGVRLGVVVQPTIITDLDVSAQGYTGDRTRAFFRDLLGEVQLDASVRAAAIMWLAPFGQGTADAGVWSTERDSSTAVDTRVNHVSAAYFAAAGIEIQRGRTFRDDETLRSDSSAVRPVVVSQLLATRLYGSADPIGRRLRRKYFGPNEYEIVGVVADARTVTVSRAPEPYLYEPIGQGFLSKRVTLLVRAAREPAAAVAATRRAIRALDPTLPVFDVRSLAAQIDRQLFEQIAIARLTMLFAVVAVLLASVGLYGLMSFVVNDRTREFGIRAALGARGATLVGPVIRSAATLGAVGIAAGAAVAVASAGLVRNRLYGVQPLDVATFVGAGLVLVAVAVIAVLVPAWRVTRLDPIIALRRNDT